MTSTKRLAVLAIAAAALVAPALAQTHAPPTLEQRAARFDKADANKDGKLTKAEFTAALPAKAADRADRMWSRVNPTGKESVTKAEYLAAPMGRGGKADASGSATARPS